MAARAHVILAFAATLAAGGGGVALAQPDAGPGTGVPIASRPPAFRIYDVDARQQEMRGLIAALAGKPGLSHRQADDALGQLDDIKREEDRLRARNGGRLDVAAIRTIDARLNALSRRLGLREARR